MSVGGAPPCGGVFWLGEGSATLVVCVQSLHVFNVEEGGFGPAGQRWR